MPSYLENLKGYFGGDPTRYAEEIKRKLQSGTPLSDPQAAAEFMAAYPQYFQTAQNAPSPAPDLLREVRAAKPAPVTPPAIQERPGQTVDLTPWLQAIGQQPRQWRTPQPITPRVFDLTQLQQAIQRPLPQLGERTFTWEQLAQALAAQQQAGGVLPAISPARFATPEQFGQWIAQFQQVQEPWLQAATQLAEAEANRQLQRLQQQWAARGLLASGTAAAQEREAAADLGRQLAETRTRALADAVGQALQAGQLSLEEAAQLWQQALQRSQFEQARAQDYVRNLLAATRLEEEARQFERQQGLAEWQAQVDNLLRALSQQEQMRQWEQAFGLDVERLRSQDWANWLDQLARYWQTEVGQSQWAQELGLQRAAQELQRWAETQRLNQAAQEAWLDALLRAGGLAEEARQFERRMPLWEAELTGLLYGQPTLGARQFDWQRALQEAGLTGIWQGQPTWERLLQEAQLTGMYQGKPTWQRILEEAGLTGYYQGKPTLERWWRQQQLSQAQAEAQQPSATERRTVALSRIAKELASMEKAGEKYEVAYGWLFTEAIPVLGEYGVSPSEALNLFASIYASSPEEYELRKQMQQARQKGRK